MSTIKSVCLPLLLIAGLLTSGGCPDKDKHASIEAMNEGIKAAQLNSYTAALKHLEKAVKAYPDNHRAWFTMGQIYIDQDNWPEAVRVLDEAVRIAGDQPMYQMLLGIAHYNEGKPDTAQPFLEKAVQLEDRLARAHFYLGLVYEGKDQPQEAAKEWTRAAMLDPTAGRPFVSLGRLYLMWDKVDQAIQVLEQGKEYVLDENKTDVYYYLGFAYDAKKEWDNSIAAYSSAIDVDKTNIEAKFQRGLAYAKKGDKKLAREDLQEYVKAAGETGESSYNKQEANKALMTLIAE